MIRSNWVIPKVERSVGAASLHLRSINHAIAGRVTDSLRRDAQNGQKPVLFHEDETI
jgi:hypothetical protein